MDTSAQDTAERIIKGYFNYQNVKVEKDVTLENIKQELYKGNAVIAPTDGQKLGNLNFAQPGPDRHMLIIIGYDSAKKEFITNDPGTRKGEKYRYEENILYEAIRDYPTGSHEPIVGAKKDIIVVMPEK